MFKLAFLVAGSLLFASASLADEKPFYSLKSHGSLLTKGKPYYVRITTNSGATEVIQPPHTRFYYEAKALYPTTSQRKLLRSFLSEGQVTLVMTQSGKRILSMTLMSGPAIIEVGAEPIAQQNTLHKDLQREVSRESRRVAELERRSRVGLRVELHDRSHQGKSGGMVGPGLVHDYDLIRVVETLRDAKAQSISINSVPVTNSASIRCVGSFIHVGKQAVSPPYAVEALGNPEALKKALSVRKGVLDEFRLSGPIVRFSPPRYTN